MWFNFYFGNLTSCIIKGSGYFERIGDSGGYYPWTFMSLKVNIIKHCNVQGSLRECVTALVKYMNDYPT